jgi:hypothetical protein
LVPKSPADFPLLPIRCPDLSRLFIVVQARSCVRDNTLAAAKGAATAQAP